MFSVLGYMVSKNICKLCHKLKNAKNLPELTWSWQNKPWYFGEMWSQAQPLRSSCRSCSSGRSRSPCSCSCPPSSSSLVYCTPSSTAASPSSWRPPGGRKPGQGRRLIHMVNLSRYILPADVGIYSLRKHSTKSTCEQSPTLHKVAISNFCQFWKSGNYDLAEKLSKFLTKFKLHQESVDHIFDRRHMIIPCYLNSIYKILHHLQAVLQNL